MRPIVHLREWALCGVALVFSTSLCHASVTINLNPTADAFVSTGPTGNLSANNFGGATNLSVAAAGLSKGQFQTYLQFDLSGTKSTLDSTLGVGTWQVQSVTLSFTTTSAPVGDTTFNVNGSGSFKFSLMTGANGNNWTEGTGTVASPTTSGITFNNQTTFRTVNDPSLGIYTFGGGTTGTSGYSLTLVGALVSDITSGNLASIDVLANSTTVSYMMGSRESAIPPVLTITVIPEPSVWSMAALGGGILLGGRRFFRRKN